MIAIPVIDGHIDLAWNKLALGREFEDSVETKAKKDCTKIKNLEGIATVGFPELKNANVRAIFATIWVETIKSLNPSLGPKYRTRKEAAAFAMQQYEYYLKLSQQYSNIVLVDNYLQLSDILTNQAYSLGVIPIIEGADFIDSDIDLKYWIELGVKIIAPIWQSNQYGGCSELGGGLTDKGRRFVKDLSKYNIAIDIAHMSPESANSTIFAASTMIINTHTACRHFVDDSRLIDDFQIRKIHESNGVIGLMTWGKKLSINKPITIDNFIDHIDYIANLTGTCANIAIGSSMDGGYGAESLPIGLQSIESLPLIAERMLNRGYDLKAIEDIFYKNWLRVIKYAMS